MDFDKKFARVRERMRRNSLVESVETINEWVKSGRVLSITLTVNKEWGDKDDENIVDYSVELSDGRNVSDLGIESFEDTVTEIAEELKKREE